MYKLNLESTLFTFYITEKQMIPLNILQFLNQVISIMKRQFSIWAIVLDYWKYNFLHKSIGLFISNHCNHYETMTTK